MDLRERLMATDIQHLTETLRALSEEVLLIQDFVKHAFGAQLAAFLQIRGRIKPLKNSKPVFSAYFKASRLKNNKTSSSNSHLRRISVGKLVPNVSPSSKTEPPRQRTAYSESPIVHNALSDEEVVTMKGTPADCVRCDGRRYADFLSSQKDGQDPETNGCIYSKDDDPEFCSDHTLLAVKVELTGSDDESNADETDVSHFHGMEHGPQFLIAGEGQEELNPPPAKREKRGGRTKDSTVWSEFQKIEDKWTCIHCQYAIKYAQLSRLKKHLDNCRGTVENEEQVNRQRSATQYHQIRDKLSLVTVLPVPRPD